MSLADLAHVTNHLPCHQTASSDTPVHIVLCTPTKSHSALFLIKLHVFGE